MKFLKLFLILLDLLNNKFQIKQHFKKILILYLKYLKIY